MNPPRRIALCLLLALCVPSCHGFGLPRLQRPQQRPQQQPKQQKGRRETRHAKRGHPLEQIASTSTVALPPLLMASSDPLAFAATAVSSNNLLPMDSRYVGEFFGDMSHVALDLATFLGCPSRVLLQCSFVVGRLCAMAADYLPDHYLLPEEMVFQMFMLGVAWMGLVQSAAPVALAACASDIGTRDGKAFCRLFAPAGTTWNQYKAMSVVALEWVQAEPNQVITNHNSDEKIGNNSFLGNHADEDDDDDKYLYWLYSGEAAVHNNRGEPVYTVQHRRQSSDDDVGLRLFGEARLLERMDQTAAMKAKKKSRQAAAHAAPALRDVPSTVVAGPQGATLLRIDAAALGRLMDFDQDLAPCIRNLLFRGMQDKLAAKYNDA